MHYCISKQRFGIQPKSAYCTESGILIVTVLLDNQGYSCLPILIQAGASEDKLYSKNLGCMLIRSVSFGVGSMPTYLAGGIIIANRA